MYIVPGSFGLVSAVLAAMTILAPSCAAFRAIHFPIPRLAPVMNNVRPASLLRIEEDVPVNTKQNDFIKSKLPSVFQQTHCPNFN